MATNMLLNMSRDVIIVKRVLRGRMYQREVPVAGFLSPPEAAALLDIGLRHLYRLLNHNVLSKCKRNGRVFIPCREVMKRMERG